MGRGSADEAIVVAKRLAEEDTATNLRIKLVVSCSGAGDEGRNMIPSYHISNELML